MWPKCAYRLKYLVFEVKCKRKILNFESLRVSEERVLELKGKKLIKKTCKYHTNESKIFVN